MLSSDEKNEVVATARDLLEMNNKTLPDRIALMWVSVLEKYTFEMVMSAITKASSLSRYAITLADIESSIHGELPTPDEIVGLAKARNTPLGIYSAIVIGSWDLDNLDSFSVRQRAQEVLASYSKFCRRAVNGEYTKHEISTMIKYKVNPLSSISDGRVKPIVTQEIKKLANEVMQNKKLLMLEETKSSSERLNNKEKLANLLSDAFGGYDEK